MKNFKADGKASTAQVGSQFENEVLEHIEPLLKSKLEKGYRIKIGISTKSKPKIHEFDLGNNNHLIECKSHSWTKGSNVPSAKLSIWNEAMYYFQLAPKNYRKLFICRRALRDDNKESLADYYLKTYSHLIPDDVEIWELDLIKKEMKAIN